MDAGTILSLLSSFNPSSAEITNLFGGLAKIDPKTLDVIMQCLDPQMVQKMAGWSAAFCKNINDVKQVEEQNAGEPGNSVDFDDVMDSTKWVGRKLSMIEIDTANMQVTQAIKANNWMEAINVAVSVMQIAAV